MRRFTTILLLMVMVLLFGSCDLFEKAEDEIEGEEEPLEFATEPTPELSEIIEDHGSDFTWGYFQDNVRVNLFPGSSWSGELVLSSFQVRNGDVVNRTTSDPVATSAEELAGGISTEELFPGSS